MKHAIAALLAAIATCPSFADGRTDWVGYDWRTASYGECLDTEAGCHAFHSKWDWKRNQWVDIVYGLLPNGELALDYGFTNGDPNDSDFVCVTVLFLDGLGRNVAASHRNIEIGPRSSRTVQDLLPLTPTSATNIRTVEFGSKQCREGAGQDDHILEAVKAKLRQ